MLPVRNDHTSSAAARVSVYFLFVSILASSSGALAIQDFFPEERDALIQLRDIVYSSFFNLHRNWTGPPCDKNNSSRWAGVGCSDWHVTHLVLEGINLTGSLHPTTLLQNLTFLTKLSFRNNSLNGPLPNLTNLVHLEHVLLSRNRFSGSIPSGYIDLPDLIGLELQENELSGLIPPFDQQSLVAFNVSHNHLQGKVPETPVLRRFTKSSFDNNSGLCGGGVIIGLNPCPNPIPFAPAPVPEAPWPPSEGKNGGRGLKLWSIVVIVAAAALVPLCMGLIFLCYCSRKTAQGRRTRHEQQQPQDLGESSNKGRPWPEFTEEPESTHMELNFFNKPLLFDLDELLCGAAQVIGRPRKMGTTYKVILECGLIVAVKRLKIGPLSKKEFSQQMHLLGNVKHENLVEIIAFHYSKEEKLIVYEFVPDGNLFGLLHENRGVGRMPLDWNARLSIIKDIAEALEFLHQCLDSRRVIHGNLKSSNVLIQRLDDGKFLIKLTDYGFLPLATPQKLAVGKTPELLSGKKPTNKADVYCFGILLLEVVTGKVPHPLTGSDSSSSAGSDQGQGDTTDLSSWVRAAVNNDWSTDILDVDILGEKEGYDEMLKLTNIALECTDMVPERRPGMSQVSSRIRDMLHHMN
ncbi:probable leucine-rich repeat receptor-like protein kinase At1g68400 [Primulina eburnea]|uniref:probable leucine-rich repeat receptor-like protein kinase At1g68400 n=1 Tax=Primulina eburnea TaxID=1245227 RepID=UPI003C6C6E5B